MAETQTFIISDRTFEYRRLKPREALRGLKIVGAILAPIFSANTEAGEAAIAKELVGALDQLVPLADLFAPQCKIEWVNGNLVALKPILDDVFTGKTLDMVAWLAKCVSLEYGDFLDGNGLATLGAMMGNLFGSPSGSTGMSGESPQMSE